MEKRGKWFTVDDEIYVNLTGICIRTCNGKSFVPKLLPEGAMTYQEVVHFVVKDLVEQIDGDDNELYIQLVDLLNQKYPIQSQTESVEFLCDIFPQSETIKFPL